MILPNKRVKKKTIKDNLFLFYRVNINTKYNNAIAATTPIATLIKMSFAFFILHHLNQCIYK